MPVDVERRMTRCGAMPPLHFLTGARLGDLNAKIIVNGNELDHAGEMSVDDQALLPRSIEALSAPNVVSAGRGR